MYTTDDMPVVKTESVREVDSVSEFKYSLFCIKFFVIHLSLCTPASGLFLSLQNLTRSFRCEA